MKRFWLFVASVLLLAACQQVPAPQSEPATQSKPITRAKTNGKIAFVTNRDGNYEIYVMNSDGTNPTNLSNNPAYEGGTAWSPDGTKIAFSSDRGGDFPRDGDLDIYVMNADSSNIQKLTDFPSTMEAVSTWSPDGSKIAFTKRQKPFDAEIYLINADGSNPINLTNNPAFDSTPVWSPDGTKIAFVSDRADTKYNIYVMNADGSNIKQLTNTALPGGDYNPSWSPDGSKIAFDSTRGSNNIFTSDIYLINPDGSGEIKLTNDGTSGGPIWSPDGTKIAFSSIRDGNSEVYVMDSDGSNQIRLTNNPAVDIASSWQPVLASYKFKGFFRPVKNPPTLNRVHAGQTVPIIFSLDGNYGLDILAAGSPSSQEAACKASAMSDESDLEQEPSEVDAMHMAGRNGLFYLKYADKYVYLWKTNKSWAGTCRQFVLTLNDGTSHTANFKFR